MHDSLNGFVIQGRPLTDEGSAEKISPAGGGGGEATGGGPHKDHCHPMAPIFFAPFSF